MQIVIILISAALFLAIILNLAAKPKFTAKLNSFLIPVSAVGGIILYGAGFTSVLDDPLQIIVRTIFDVSRMYAGVNDLGSVSGAPLFQYPIVVTIFWLLHFMAFYAMASATISVLGEKALKKLKFWLQRYGGSIVIYGINESSAELGRSLIGGGKKHVTFVSAAPDASLEKSVNDAGALVRTDAAALEPNRSFLRSLASGKGSPVLTLYAMDEDAEANTAYAKTLLAALTASGADTKNVSLILRGADDGVDSHLLNSESHKGYADVKYFSDTYTASRMMISAMPPYRKMEFSEDGRAKGDFDAVIVGFGKTGFSVLRQLFCNSQFEGSRFSAAVFSPRVQNESGYAVAAFPEMFSSQKIRLIDRDARSPEFYEYLFSRRETLRYVAICTGDPETDSEIFSDVIRYLRQIRCSAAVCRCHAREVFFAENADSAVRSLRVFTKEAFSEEADRLARILNHSYVNDPAVSEEEAWKQCDYLGRESSRASAAFAPAFLKMTGMTDEEVQNGGWDRLSEVQKENLARTEHLRWCAFYEAMGFTGMTDEIIKERGEAYLLEKEKTGASSIRIAKDLEERCHACLCSYDELPALSALEEKYTGRYTDYQDMDLRNVLSLPALLSKKRSADVKASKNR